MGNGMIGTKGGKGMIGNDGAPMSRAMVLTLIAGACSSAPMTAMGTIGV